VDKVRIHHLIYISHINAPVFFYPGCLIQGFFIPFVIFGCAWWQNLHGHLLSNKHLRHHWKLCKIFILG